MWVSLLKSKIHGVRVTEARLDYEGSILIDSSLLEMAQIAPNEQVHVWNLRNGQRFETYAIEGSPNSGDVMVNGAAAHLVEKGDSLIVAAFAFFETEEAKKHKPRIVLIQSNNRGHLK